jgi:Flp pilus assembly protein TadG
MRRWLSDQGGLRGQRGQVMPIFMLVATFLIGAIAVAVDYGFLTDQHRNLQTFADHAAVAGAQQLSSDGSSTVNGRRAAMTYLRDSIGATSTSMSLASGVPCAGGTQPFTANIDNCKLPSPYADMTVTIHSPGDYTHSYAYGTPSVSVKISDTGVDNPAMLMGLTAPVGAYAEAKAQLGGQRLPTALYSDGCFYVNSPILLAAPTRINGETYINQCTIGPGGALGGLLGGGLCVDATPEAPGNIVVGPEAFIPSSGISLLGLNGCNGILTGIAGIATGVNSDGSITQIASSMQPPALPPPPNVPTNVGGAATNACTNGKGGSNCYNPGVYTNNPLIVSNNLNPGIYVVDISSGNCYTDSTTTSCGGVVFTGNTLNANYNDVVHSCWALPNNPNTDAFTAPCPDGFITNPAGAGANIPTLANNYGVTFILTGKAGFCMGANTSSTDWHCVAAGGAINVLLSPYCASGFASGKCINAANEDGAYTVYGSSQGAIHASGSGILDMTGTVYLPKGSLISDPHFLCILVCLVGSATLFNLTGQMVIHDVNVSTNTQLPVIYYRSTMGAVMPTVVTLVQ